MSSRKTGAMNEEDRILWTMVADSTTPLKPVRVRRVAAKPVVAEQKPAAKPPTLETKSAIILPAYTPPKPAPIAPKGHIDRQTTDKIAKGRLALQARIDLHGMRQDEAYSLLLSFVSRAHERDMRYVLVITGKGSGGDGVLRRSAPQWLQTAPFRAYVSGIDQAARGHGGAGAFYVRIKRRQAATP